MRASSDVVPGANAHMPPKTEDRWSQDPADSPRSSVVLRQPHRRAQTRRLCVLPPLVFGISFAPVGTRSCMSAPFCTARCLNNHMCGFRRGHVWCREAVVSLLPTRSYLVTNKNCSFAASGEVMSWAEKLHVGSFLHGHVSQQTYMLLPTRSCVCAEKQ